MPERAKGPRRAPAGNDWVAANQRHLAAASSRVRERLGARSDGASLLAAERALAEASAAMPAPPALDRLRDVFGLSPFEVDVVLLGLGLEIEGEAMAAALSAAGGGPAPTFGLALARLPGAHWDACTPSRPLRAFRLLEVGVGPTLVASPLRLDERILNFLIGVAGLDERLDFLEPVSLGAGPVASQIPLVDAIAGAWGSADAPRRIVELNGADATSKRAVAAGACARLSLGLHALPARALTSTTLDERTLAGLLTREARLSGSAILIDLEESNGADPAVVALAGRLIERIRAPLFVSRRECGPPGSAARIAFEVARPTRVEQVELLRAAMATETVRDADVDVWIERVAAQFDLSRPAIELSAATALAEATGAERGPALWAACRRQGRNRLQGLAQRIETRAGWNDLVVPAGQREKLRDIARRVRLRTQVYERWGFADKSTRGLGLSALFAGPSGTGKTMAAEILANELGLDVYRVDLSQVVNKYIGETEKNLARVFDAAEDGACVLLFDEADALFGKRSDVKDSHDRYANIEISYLLQRMEEYRGLSILTTNMRAALDQAFLRRLAFVVEFPFPDYEQRLEIWRKVFPASTPTQSLDWSPLARLQLAGGNIRNVAMGAAFLAAAATEPVQMQHVLAAAQGEYAKLERPMPTDLR